MMITASQSPLNSLRPAIVFALVFIIPPTLWTLLIWEDKLPPIWSHPVLAYGLMASVMLPGLVGIRMLHIRRSTKFLMLPFYLVGMTVTLLFWGLLFACGAMNDCP
ncbi:hypothetical protein [Sphingomonas sp. PB4P5]|uniref:hypothetical protein n=1 Tax=Parasphingomonas puruogangriensis TaxID=3096155 RepID=UPI002FCAC0F4